MIITAIMFTLSHLWPVGEHSSGLLDLSDTVFLVCNSSLPSSTTECSRILFDVFCPTLKSTFIQGGMIFFNLEILSREHNLGVGMFIIWG